MTRRQAISMFSNYADQPLLLFMLWLLMRDGHCGFGVHEL